MSAVQCLGPALTRPFLWTAVDWVLSLEQVRGEGREQVRGEGREQVRGEGREQVRGEGREQVRGEGREQVRGEGIVRGRGGKVLMYQLFILQVAMVTIS